MSRRAGTHIDSPTAVGERVREARRRLGLTQRELAFDGCTPAYISRIEAGGRTPSWQILRELAARLDVSVEYLAGGEVAAEPSQTSGRLFDAELLSLKDPAAAREVYERMRSDPAAPPRDRATATSRLGALLFQAGEHAAALPYLEEALADPALPAGPHWRTSELLGRAYAQLQRYDEAFALFERSLESARARSDEIERLRFSVLLANSLIDRGRTQRAEELLASILDVARRAEDPVTRASLYWSQARLHASQARPELAAHYGSLAVQTLESTEHVLFVAKAFLLLARLANDRARAEEALGLVERGWGAIHASGNRVEIGKLLLEKARATAALGDLEEASAIALDAVSRFQGSSPTEAGRGYALAAGVLRELGDGVRALELYELAAESLPAGDRELVDVHRAIGELLEASGRQAEALQAFKRALETKTRPLASPT